MRSLPRHGHQLLRHFFLLGTLIIACASLEAADSGAPSAPQPQELTAEQRQLVAELVEVLELKKIMRQGVQQMLTLQRPVLESQLRKAPEGYIDQLEELMVDRMLQQDLVDLYGPLYVQHFSDAELQDLLNFHRSPLGRKSIAAQPAILAGSMEKGRAVGEDAARYAFEVLKQRFPNYRPGP
ncbi:MAG: DUF2059 domain-containing protein [Pseudomonadota bacterium]